MCKLMLSLFPLWICFLWLTNETTAVHLTDSNLITDVSGIVKFHQNYHLFYQYFNLNPRIRLDNSTIFSAFNNITWGHATSSDLIKWNIHEKLISAIDDPEITIFNGRVITNVSKLLPFTGSTIVDYKNASGLLKKRDEPVLMVYTSLSKFLFNERDPITGEQNFIFSSVHMFYSYNGMQFHKYPKPLIEKSLTIRNYRDPSVRKYREGQFSLILVENRKIGFWRSTDLINWKKTSIFEHVRFKDEVEWETPNLVRLDNEYLLVISSNRNPDPNDANFCTLRYFVGEFDGSRFDVIANQTREFDGPDLYAISISEDENIMMGMLNNWKYMAKLDFNGTLSYPRRIGKVIHQNLTYLTQQFVNLNAFNELIFESSDVVNDKLVYNFNVNRPYYLKIKLDNLNCENECDFKFEFADTNNTIRIGYEYSKNSFYLDRSESIQINRAFNHVHEYKIRYNKLLDRRSFDIDMILDVNTVEMLTDNGVMAMTALHMNQKIFQSLSLITNKNYKISKFIVYYSQ